MSERGCRLERRFVTFGEQYSLLNCTHIYPVRKG